jgi:hypothetical protein
VNDEQPDWNWADAAIGIVTVVAMITIVVAAAMKFAEWLGLGNMAT